MNRDALSEPFFRDRSEMRGHATPIMEQIAAGLPHQEGQLHLMLGWVEDLLGDERLYPPGRTPRLTDFSLYQRLWWLKALAGKAAHVLAGYPCIRDWMARIAAIGHGERSELAPQEANCPSPCARDRVHVHASVVVTAPGGYRRQASRPKKSRGI